MVGWHRSLHGLRCSPGARWSGSRGAYRSTRGGAMIVAAGPSGRPIVGIITWGAKNLKTGAQDQLWILDASESPASAVASGADVSVCGSCTRRRSLATASDTDPCYVLVLHAPRSVWEAYQRGSYTGRTLQPAGSLRLGAYGDPAALPGRVVARLVRRWAQHGHTWTGFTHQWRTARHLRRYCMASGDTPPAPRAAARRGVHRARAGARAVQARVLVQLRGELSQVAQPVA